MGLKAKLREFPHARRTISISEKKSGRGAALGDGAKKSFSAKIGGLIEQT